MSLPKRLASSLARLDNGHVETVLLDHEQLHAGLVAGAHHVVGVREP
jgi:hypothetical protein